MKPARFLLIFTIALICLLALQGIWLYNTYELKYKEIKEIVNALFSQALEKETNFRFVKVKNTDIPEGTTIPIATINEDENKDVANEKEIEGINSFFYRAVQVLTFELGVPFDIKSLDSIYHSMLIENKLPLKYEIIYMDSLDNILEMKGKEISKGYKTAAIPIVHGRKAQAIIKIPAPIVFRNMVGILLASLLILIFIIICLIYEINTFINEKTINQLRENFTHALTHDMKSPIGTIHAVLNHLEKGTLDNQPQMKEQFIRVAIEQNLDIQAMINQILTVAQIDKNELNLNKQEIDLPEMIDHHINKFMVKGGKEILFSKEIDLKDKIVYADSLYLSNAISNLIDNAIKYSGESVHVHIDCTVGDKQIYIRIKDNGFGIPEKDQKKIFERFERGVEIKRKHASGFGLGLNYVKKVVEAHNGIIAISSKEGQGSEFTITLPILLTIFKGEDKFTEEELCAN